MTKEPVSMMDPQMKQWSSAMVQRGIQYQQTQQQIPMAMSNTLPINSDALPSMTLQPKQTQNMYMDEDDASSSFKYNAWRKSEWYIQITSDVGLMIEVDV